MSHHFIRRTATAVLGACALIGFVPNLIAAEAASTGAKEEKKEEVLAEVQVTGSRIVRKDLESNSPLVTVDRQQLDDNSFISIEEVLNDLPQFMAGGVGTSTGSVTGLQAANGLDGGRGSGDAFNSSLLPDNGGLIGTVPGAANVNLRGLGANRSLTLIDGHRGMPYNATMTVDLNTIPSIAIGNIEVITGGASAVYGADALAGVTNVRFRDNFEGVEIRTRAGLNQVGDGGEYQISGLMGTRLSGKGNAMIGVEYSKREISYWKNREFFTEALESPYSGAGNWLFAGQPYYTAGGTATANGASQTAASGTTLLNNVYTGNAPTQAAVNSVFFDRTCGANINCVSTTGNANGFAFNNMLGRPVSAVSLFTRNGQCTVAATANPCVGQAGAAGTTTYYGPQGFEGPLGGTEANPDEVTCAFTTVASPNRATGFSDRNCNPLLNHSDWGRWLTGPREAYTLFGRAKYELNDHLTMFTTLSFASSDTTTRREPAPFAGTFTAAIPHNSSPTAKYLPSIVTQPKTGQVLGQTLPEYRVGGARGTNCPDLGGCSIQQAFPIPTELRTLLDSRPTVNFATTPPAGTAIGTAAYINGNPYKGLSACNMYNLIPQGSTVPGAQTNPNAFYPGTTTPVQYTVQVDPNTGAPFQICGPNSAWRLNWVLDFLPPRGTNNTSRLFQLATGLQGDLGISDWTWEFYTSYGDARVQTEYVGFTSNANYLNIIQAPNYGQGLTINGTVGQKTLSCTSGLNPFVQAQISADCIDAITSDQIDRNAMNQRVYELTTQGHLVDLPAGEARAALGATYRKNNYVFTPDTLRARNYLNDTSAGQFGVGEVDAGVSVKEAYGELLIPVLRDLPFIRSFELELGARTSKYNTGQEVFTWKALGSWTPVNWLRARGGYNKAERTPNMAELYATATTSSQFSEIPTDPCRNNATAVAPIYPGPVVNGVATNTSNRPNNPNRAQLQALCAAQINSFGAGGASEFHADPDNWDVGGGNGLVVGNPNVKSERGDTWTMGIAFTSPFTHPLLSRISGTVDWYEARVTDPIEALTVTNIVNTCYNTNGLNPTYTLDDSFGFCDLIKRDPTTGGILQVLKPFDNLGKLVIRGLDFSTRWSGRLTDLGFGENAPGTLSLSINGNYLIDQIQRYGANVTDDFAGFGGASRLRASTQLGYNWGAGHRVSLNWQYRLGTQTATAYAVTANAEGSTNPQLVRNPNMAGYGSTNLFSATAGTRVGPVNASLSINNLLNSKPKAAGYDFRDPNQGLGTYNAFADLIGRRYSLNLTMEF